MSSPAEPSARHRALGKTLVWLFTLGGLVTYVYLGRNLWFYSDEWDYIVNRRPVSDPATLFQSHNGQWQTIPILVYRGLLNFTGLHTYIPYLLLVVLLYLVVCRLEYAVMQRAGVAPWIAALLVGALVFLGFANENVIFAAQITYLGSIAIGLWQVLLVDDGADTRRGVQVAVLGVLALMCSNLGVVTAIVVFVHALVRQGWKLALGVTVPPAIAFIVWSHFYGDAHGTGLGPTLHFVEIGLRAAGQQYLQRGELGAVVLLILLALGLVFALVDRIMTTGWRSALAVTVPFLIGALAFLVITGSQRSTAFGAASAAQPRYAGIVVIFLLPVAGVVAETLWRRSRIAGVVVVAVLLLGVPGNVRDLSQITTRAATVQSVRTLILAVPSLPAAAKVPADMRPFPESHAAPSLTVGYLRSAKSDGDLPPTKTPSAAVRADDAVRLSLYQTDATRPLGSCRVLMRPVVERVRRGSVLYLRGGFVGVINRTRGAAYGLSIYYNPNRGNALRVLSGPLTLQLRTYGVNGPAALCQ